MKKNFKNTIKSYCSLIFKTLVFTVVLYILLVIAALLSYGIIKITKLNLNPSALKEVWHSVNTEQLLISCPPAFFIACLCFGTLVIIMKFARKLNLDFFFREETINLTNFFLLGVSSSTILLTLLLSFSSEAINIVTLPIVILLLFTSILETLNYDKMKLLFPKKHPKGQGSKKGVPRKYKRKCYKKR
ncbi:hypothetical protein [Pseudolactococcus yaeyamensis]